MHRSSYRTAAVIVVVAFAAATPSVAQEIVDFDNGLLPSLPTTQGKSLSELTALVRPTTTTNGVEVARGIIFDRIVRPRCIFIANLNQGGNAVQTVRVGSMTFICP